MITIEDESQLLKSKFVILCTGHISRQSHREKYPVVSREMPKRWMRVDWGDKGRGG